MTFGRHILWKVSSLEVLDHMLAEQHDFLRGTFKSGGLDFESI
jgi:hypothetical protein